MLRAKKIRVLKAACAYWEKKLKTQEKGKVRNQMVAQLARLDQIIAKQTDCLTLERGLE